MSNAQMLSLAYKQFSVMIIIHKDIKIAVELDYKHHITCPPNEFILTW